MEVWDHDGKQYGINSFYSLPDNAWQYELAGISGPSGAEPCLAIVIPDATPDDAPFTPKPAGHALVTVTDGVTPWPILRRFLDLVESTGDIVDEHRTSPAAGEQILTSNVWCHDGQRFELNSFYFSGNDTWCYELYEVRPDSHSNDYIEVQIPDASPYSGPFVPEPAARVIFTAHGQWVIPWPVFQRFICVLESSGDIVEASPAAPPHR